MTTDTNEIIGPGEEPVQLHIRKLSLSNFRNYSSLSLSLRPGAVVLTGENGAGKTNLLEAISFLSPGRGLRRAKHEDVARLGAGNGFAIHAELAGPFGNCRIGTGTTGAIEGRQVRINGEPAKNSEALLEWLRVIWVTPSMDSLFTGPSAERRRFLDRMVLAIDPAHARRTLDYEKSMRARNRLFADDVRNDAWFDAIEVQMAETGVAIAAARAEMLRLLTAMFERVPPGPFPKAELALSGLVENILNGRPAIDVEEDFRLRLSGERGRDRAAGRTLEGPHLADMLVWHKPKAMPAASCSTGEQKALLLGLVLAHGRLTAEMSGTAPIFLLDEISAHFDADRRAALFDILDELNCQAFMTGTEPVLFSSLEGKAQFLKVSAGNIEET